MHFRISMTMAIEEKIDRLVDLTNAGSPLQAFWNDLSKVLNDLTERPMEMGERVFDY